jgi:hypothetical protein
MGMAKVDAQIVEILEADRLDLGGGDAATLAFLEGL